MAQSNSNTETLEVNEEKSFGEQYSTLLESSSTLGSHFQFSVEKQWDGTKDFVIPSHFILNLKSLAKSLSEIPFFERQQIVSSPLDNECKTEAAAGLQNIKRSKNSISLCLNSRNVQNNQKSLNLNENVDSNEPITSDNENSSIVSTNSEFNSTEAAKIKVSLDDWLDSVLDD